MKTKDAIDHFGGIPALAKLLKITAPALHQWGEYPPDKRQLQIEVLSGGVLRAEPGCVDRVLGIPGQDEKGGE